MELSRCSRASVKSGSYFRPVPLHWQPVSVLHQDVVALEPQRQGGIVAGLKLQVDKPGLDLCDKKHRVRLGRDRGEIDIEDANVAKLTAQEQLQPRSGIALQQLFHCRVERLGHQRLFESVGSEEVATRGNRGWP